MHVEKESVGCPGDWSSNNNTCGICAAHKNDHWKRARRVKRKRLGRASSSRGGRPSRRSVKAKLRPFKAWLHYGDAKHPPMHTVSFVGNHYDLSVLKKMAEQEGEPLRVQRTPSTKRRK